MKKLLLKVHRFSRRNMLCISAVSVIAVAALGYSIINQSKQAVVKPASQTGVQAAGTDSILNGTWQYLPGTVADPKGLRILPVNFAIVNQDGTGGQPNPGVNLYGTHFEVSKDFSIEASLDEVTAPASVQFYGEVPIIYDEFRIERKSVRATIVGANLTVSMWNGSSNQPSLTQTVAYQPGNGPLTLSMNRVGRNLVFYMNGVSVLTVKDSSIFASNQVWIGASADTQSWVLTDVQAAGINGGRATAVDTTTLAVTPNDTGIQAMASKKRPGFTVGAAMALAPATSDNTYANVAFSGNFGSLTTENALKWQFVHPTQSIYTFQEADALVALAEKNHMAIHGHTLVFGEANPKWIQDLPANQKEAAMIDHIKTVVGHFKGKMATWDVVNEPFDDDEWDQLRPNMWYKAMGESYIAKAFNAAHAADPNAKLFINEYGLEEDGDRWNAMLALVKKLKQQGVPINGIGFQSHVYERADKINPTVMRKHFQQLAALGLLARVSEMDVYSEDGQTNQASQYSQVFGACLAEPNCINFTTWGVTDRYDMFKDDDGSFQYGEDFLWDHNLKPTPAVTAIQQLLR